jgi:hypothetical protein
VTYHRVAKCNVDSPTNSTMQRMRKNTKADRRFEIFKVFVQNSTNRFLNREEMGKRRKDTKITSSARTQKIATQMIDIMPQSVVNERDVDNPAI